MNHRIAASARIAACGLVLLITSAVLLAQETAPPKPADEPKQAETAQPAAPAPADAKPAEKPASETPAEKSPPEKPADAEQPPKDAPAQPVKEAPKTPPAQPTSQTPEQKTPAPQPVEQLKQPEQPKEPEKPKQPEQSKPAEPPKQPEKPKEPEKPAQPEQPKPAEPPQWKKLVEKKHEAFFAWLEQNYPARADELKELGNKDPKQFSQQMAEFLKTYEPIQKTDKHNPELGQLLRQDLELIEKRDQLLLNLRNSKDKAEQDKMLDELKTIVSARFDVIIQKKQVEYNQIRERLDAMNKKLEEHGSELKKLKDEKGQSVEKRMKELTEGTIKMDWQ